MSHAADRDERLRRLRDQERARDRRHESATSVVDHVAASGAPARDIAEHVAAGLRAGVVAPSDIPRLAASAGSAGVERSVQGVIAGPPILRKAIETEEAETASTETLFAQLGAGEPLSKAARSVLEGRFAALGEDANFSTVRIHTGAEADELCRRYGAEAFTVGDHIVFRSGTFVPASRGGLELVAHELTHVLQQRRGVTIPSGISRPGDAVEVEASRTATAVTQSTATPIAPAALDVEASAAPIALMAQEQPQPTTEAPVEPGDLVNGWVIYENEARKGGTLAWRNNNPGNIRPGSFTASHGAFAGKSSGGFAVFPDKATGFAAIKSLLKEKYAEKTIPETISKYAPSSDNNDPEAYAKSIERRTGISSDRTIASLTDQELDAVASAIETVEGWREGTTVSRTDPQLPERARKTSEATAPASVMRYPGRLDYGPDHSGEVEHAPAVQSRDAAALAGQLGAVPSLHVIYEQLAHRFAYAPPSSPQQVQALRQLGYVLGQRHEDPLTGLQLYLFVPAPSEAAAPAAPASVPVLAFRGSEEGADFLDDLTPAGIGRYQFDANEVAIARILAATPSRCDVVGHSLGGALAQMCAAHYPQEVRNVVTFQSPGISREEAEGLDRHNAASPGSRVGSTHYRVEGDIVDDAGERVTEGTICRLDYTGAATPAAHTTFPLANVENQRGGPLAQRLRRSDGSVITAAAVESIRVSRGHGVDDSSGVIEHGRRAIGRTADHGVQMGNPTPGVPQRQGNLQPGDDYSRTWREATRQVRQGVPASAIVAYVQSQELPPAIRGRLLTELRAFIDMQEQPSPEGSLHRKSDGPARSGDEPASLLAIARQGISGASAAIPHLSVLQAAFGEHDLSAIRAQVGGPASRATTSVGASAYALGEHVAFRSSPDLHTAAHEAAHVIQQRGGASVPGGVGRQGDTWERHADAVADRVVSGQSATGLLSEVTSSPRATSAGMVQYDETPIPDAQFNINRALSGTFETWGGEVQTHAIDLAQDRGEDWLDDVHFDTENAVVERVAGSVRTMSSVIRTYRAGAEWVERITALGELADALLAFNTAMERNGRDRDANSVANAGQALANVADRCASFIETLPMGAAMKNYLAQVVRTAGAVGSVFTTHLAGRLGVLDSIEPNRQQRGVRAPDRGGDEGARMQIASTLARLGSHWYEVESNHQARVDAHTAILAKAQDVVRIFDRDIERWCEQTNREDDPAPAAKQALVRQEIAQAATRAYGNRLNANRLLVLLYGAIAVLQQAGTQGREPLTVLFCGDLNANRLAGLVLDRGAILPNIALPFQLGLRGNAR